MLKLLQKDEFWPIKGSYPTNELISKGYQFGVSLMFDVFLMLMQLLMYMIDDVRTPMTHQNFHQFDIPDIPMKTSMQHQWHTKKISKMHL